MKFLESFIIERIKCIKALSKHQKVLLILIILYTVVLSTLTSLRHYCFQTFAFDFGIFVQIFWNSVNGNFMFTQPRGIPTSPRSFLGVHVSPLLVLLLPIYAIIRTPYILLIIQSLFLAIPALFIYKIGIRELGKKDDALLFAIAYLIHPATLWSNWYDFHLEAFVPLFLAMTYYYYFSRDKVNLLTSIILLAATFEPAAIILFFFIIYVLIRELFLKMKKPHQCWLIRKKEFIFILGIGIFAVLYYLLSEKLMLSVWPERNVYEPAKIFGRIDYKALLVKLSYLLMLSAPLAFLSFYSPLELIPAMPYLFLAMTTDYEPYYTINWQYPALIVVPFFVSAIFSYKREKNDKKKIAVAMLIFFLLFSPATPLMSQFSVYWSMPIPTMETYLKHQALSFVEKNATVLVQENIFSHLAEREVVYSIWPVYLEPPEYIVVDVMNAFQFYHEPSLEPINQALFRLVNDYDYGIIAVANGLLVLKKDYHGPRHILMPLHSSLKIKSQKPFISFQDCFSENSWFIPDWVSFQGDHLFLKRGIIGNAWWGPYITVPPGRYRVEVELSIDEEVSGCVMDILVYCYSAGEVYATRSILGEGLKTGERTVISFDFELTKWVPAIEVVGMSYGITDICVYSVKFEMTE